MEKLTVLNFKGIKEYNCGANVCIICPVHGEFYKTPYSHINLKSGCNKCKKENDGKKNENKTHTPIDLFGIECGNEQYIGSTTQGWIRTICIDCLVKELLNENSYIILQK